MFVYVIVWLAVVFGINSVSNAGGKTVIVQGEAEHYTVFQPALRALLIPYAIQLIILLQINPIIISLSHFK